MLSPQEKIRLVELQEKEKESYVPLSEQDLKDLQDRAISRTGSALGHLNGFTTLMASIGEYTDKVAKDNIRLLQEIYYLKEELEKAKSSQISFTMQTIPAPEGDTARNRRRKSK